MLINAIRNAINYAIGINWVNVQKDVTLYAKATLYVFKKLKYAKIQCYKILKR